MYSTNWNVKFFRVSFSNVKENDDFRGETFCLLSSQLCHRFNFDKGNPAG